MLCWLLVPSWGQGQEWLLGIPGVARRVLVGAVAEGRGSSGWAVSPGLWENRVPGAVGLLLAMEGWGQPWEAEDGAELGWCLMAKRR